MSVEITCGKYEKCIVLKRRLCVQIVETKSDQGGRDHCMTISGRCTHYG